MSLDTAVCSFHVHAHTRKSQSTRAHTVCEWKQPPYLQDNCAPDHVEPSKDDVFVVVLPVKQIVRHSDEGHGHQSKGEVLQEAKVEGLALTIIVSDVIWGDSRDQEHEEGTY